MLPAFCSWLQEEQPTSTSLHIALQSPEVLCVLKQITSLICWVWAEHGQSEILWFTLFTPFLPQEAASDWYGDWLRFTRNWRVGSRRPALVRGFVLLNYTASLSWSIVMCSSVCFWKLYMTFRAACPQTVAAQCSHHCLIPEGFSAKFLYQRGQRILCSNSTRFIIVFSAYVYIHRGRI
jgi:hypothetical protein